jgi:hypothetical protein
MKYTRGASGKNTIAVVRENLKVKSYVIGGSAMARTAHGNKIWALGAASIGRAHGRSTNQTLPDRSRLKTFFFLKKSRKRPSAG